MTVTNPWTIPLNGQTYACWRTEENVPQYRLLTDSEEKEYFQAPNKEKYLSDLLDS